VVFPQPVSPVTRTTLEDLHDSSSFDKKSALAFHAGRDFLCRSMDLLQLKEIAGGVCFGGVDQNTLRALGRLFIEIPLEVFFDAVFVDLDADDDGAVDDDDDPFPIGFGTDVDDKCKRGKSSRVCNMFCSSP
jgi:hypothetical protein